MPSHILLFCPAHHHLHVICFRWPGSVNVIDSAVNNFGLLVLCTELEYRVCLSWLRHEWRGEVYWVPSASNAFWKAASSQSFSIWQAQCKGQPDFLSNGGVRSDGAIKDMPERAQLGWSCNKAVREGWLSPTPHHRGETYFG